MRHKRTSYGFSLIELIVIIMIVGVLAVVAVPRFKGTNDFRARGYVDELVSAVRFAQRYAVASGCIVQIQINALNYSLTTQDADCGFGTSVLAPTGGNFAGTVPNGVTVTGGAGPHSFDALGDLAAGGGTVTVQGGGSTYSFMITPVTGFVDTP